MAAGNRVVGSGGRMLGACMRKRGRWERERDDLGPGFWAFRLEF